MQVCLELVYRIVSKTIAREGLWDRGPPPAPYLNKKNKKDGNKMNTINALKVRINNLQQRDPVGNARIIAKLKRRVRSMENK
jgi:hypothetical protein